MMRLMRPPARTSSNSTSLLSWNSATTSDPFVPFSGDWNVGEPISEELLATLNQAKQHLFSEPAPEKPEEAKEQVAKADEPGKQDA